MTLVNYIRHSRNSRSTTNNLAICSGRAKVKLGGSCWRSLTTKFNRQLRLKTGEISKLKTHMHLLLTYFHMYWRLSVLQDINMKCMGSMIKVRNPESVKHILQKHKQAKAHLHNIFGGQTTKEVAQAHTATDQRRAVARRAIQGAAAT